MIVESKLMVWYASGGVQFTLIMDFGTATINFGTATTYFGTAFVYFYYPL